MNSHASVAEKDSLQPLAPQKEDGALSSLLTPEPIPKNYGIYSIALSDAVIVTAISLAVALPVGYAAPLCLALYGLITFQEFRHDQHSPLSLFQLALAAIFCCLALAGTTLADGYATFMCAGLALGTAASIVLKKPDSLLRTKGIGALTLHMAGAWLWLAAFSLGAIALWFMPPGLARSLLPPLLALGAIAGIIYFNIFDDSILTKRKKIFTFGEFEIRQIDCRTQEFEDFLDFYSPLLASYPGFHNLMPIDKVREFVANMEEDLSGREIFVAYHNGRIVGCTASAVEDGRRLIPAEEALGFSFAPLFRIGRIANFGRFGIDERYRHNVDLYNALTKASMDSCFANDAAFIIAEIFPKDIIYQTRLGYVPLFSRSDPRNRTDYGLIGELTILINNLSHNILYDKKDFDAPFQFSEHFDPLLMERWLKRMLLLHAFQKPERCPWRYTIEAIRHILGITQSAVALKYKSRAA